MKEVRPGAGFRAGDFAAVESHARKGRLCRIFIPSSVMPAFKSRKSVRWVKPHSQVGQTSIGDFPPPNADIGEAGVVGKQFQIVIRGLAFLRATAMVILKLPPAAPWRSVGSRTSSGGGGFAPGRQVQRALDGEAISAGVGLGRRRHNLALGQGVLQALANRQAFPPWCSSGPGRASVFNRLICGTAPLSSTAGVGQMQHDVGRTSRRPQAVPVTFVLSSGRGWITRSPGQVSQAGVRHMGVLQAECLQRGSSGSSSKTELCR